MVKWNDIPEWEGYYQASNEGQIRSVKRFISRPHWTGKTNYTQSYGGKILSPKVGDGGYLYVNLWKQNKGHMRAVHRLVCAAFNSKDHKELVCNHINNCRHDNTSTNLEFITQKENLQHARNQGRR
jgi:hypothetical protein